MRFLILGRTGISAGGAEALVRGRRERSVLAMLLAARGQAVTVDRLIDEVWAGPSGPGVRRSLRVAISHLRKLCGPGVINTVGDGYLLDVSAASVDGHEEPMRLRDAA